MVLWGATGSRTVESRRCSIWTLEWGFILFPAVVGDCDVSAITGDAFSSSGHPVRSIWVETGVEGGKQAMGVPVWMDMSTVAVIFSFLVATELVCVATWLEMRLVEM